MAFKSRIKMCGAIEIIDFSPTYPTAFRARNQEWITPCFKLEELHNQVQDHPGSMILAPGGHTFYGP